MTLKTDKNIDRKLVIALILLTLAIISTVYYTTHREITDPQVLIAKTVEVSEDITTYRFVLSTTISIMPEGDVEMMSSAGSVDYPNKKIWTTVTTMDHAMEMIVIGDTAYVRELNGSWQKENVSGYSDSLWERDQLAQQRSLLQNVTNVTMQKEDTGWVLALIPDKEEVIEQMQNAGLETLKEEDLNDFTITYWIERDTYWITRIENTLEFEMNIQGLVTPIQLNNSVEFYDYNAALIIEAPM